MYFKSTLLFFILIFSTINLQSQQTITGTINHDGVERDYRLFLPSGYSSDQSLPLVFNLHGYTSNALEQEFYSEMNDVADTAKFLVCYADGIANAWNVGWNFGSTADDVGFISQLIDEFVANYNVNPARVYSCGMSNGGFMSYRLACELNDKIAAVASVTGSFAPQYLPQCQPNKPVPVLEIHGTADAVVPYTGLVGVNIHMDSVIQFWVDNNGCTQTPVVTDIPNTSILDGCTAERIDYPDCQEEAMVSLIKIIGGGHTWAGASLIIGVTNQDFDASETIWQFFNQFELDNTTSTAPQLWNHGKVSLFPNPTNHTLFVDFENDNIDFSFEIFNTNGQLVRSGRFSNKTNTIDVRGLNAGVYVMSVLGKDGGQRYLFVKM